MGVGVGVSVGVGVGVGRGVGTDGCVGCGVTLVGCAVGREAGKGVAVGWTFRVTAGVGRCVATATTGVRFVKGMIPALKEYSSKEAMAVNAKATPSHTMDGFQPGNSRGDNDAFRVF